VTGASVVPESAERETDRLVDHLFRHEGARLVAILTRIFGPERLELAEDVAQEALMTALELWPYHGVPRNPTAWLTQVAKHRALNLLKRERRFASTPPETLDHLDRRSHPPDGQGASPERSVDMDDVVRLLFVACHPELSPESRVALTLKTVAGLGVEQIAGALLAHPSAVAQRLVRAKNQVRALRVTFEFPDAELPRRLDSVLEVLYLLFNEGYAAHQGDALIRTELCDEAIRLCTLLARYLSRGTPPRVHALLALMLLQSARLPARVGPAGQLVPLESQDRTLWNRSRIAEGLRHLDQAAQGDEVSSYHLEAGIASCHAIASTYQGTDWRHILEFYDQLMEMNPSPIVALNRAVAVSRCHGPEAGILALGSVRESSAVQHYHLLWATLARFHADLGDVTAATTYYNKALACTCSGPERRFLENSLAALTSAAPARGDVDSPRRPIV
jgi:RNA polymerase sigma factor (sigma-70 family)